MVYDVASMIQLPPTAVAASMMSGMVGSRSPAASSDPPPGPRGLHSSTFRLNLSHSGAKYTLDTLSYPLKTP